MFAGAVAGCGSSAEGLTRCSSRGARWSARVVDANRPVIPPVEDWVESVAESCVDGVPIEPTLKFSNACPRPPVEEAGVRLSPTDCREESA